MPLNLLNFSCKINNRCHESRLIPVFVRALCCYFGTKALVVVHKWRRALRGRLTARDVSYWQSLNVLLDEDPVDEDEGEGHDEEDVGEVEDELGDEVLGAVPFHVPMRYSNLENGKRVTLHRVSRFRRFVSVLSTGYPRYSTTEKQGKTVG